MSEVLPFDTDSHGGVLPRPEALPPDPVRFGARLRASLPVWQGAGHRVVWLRLPAGRAALIPVAVEAGFAFHHCGLDGTDGADYLQLTRRLDPQAFVLPYASHYVGAGAVVVNERRELLTVVERRHRDAGRQVYKLPGGFIEVNEHLADGVRREVKEETGIDTAFASLVCFRHWHVNRLGRSDLYFVCRLTPLSSAIVAQDEEIAEARWLPVETFLAHEQVGVFNKRVVELALTREGMIPVSIEGYGRGDDEVEVFAPRG